MTLQRKCVHVGVGGGLFPFSFSHPGPARMNACMPGSADRRIQYKTAFQTCHPNVSRSRFCYSFALRDCLTLGPHQLLYPHHLSAVINILH